MFLQNDGIDIGQFFGMIIALIAVIVTLINFFSNIGKKQKEENLEEKLKAEGLDTKLLRDVFGPLEEEEEEEEEAPPKRERQISIPPITLPPIPPPLSTKSSDRGWPRPEEKFVFHPSLDDFRQKTKIEDRKLDIGLRSPDELVSESLKAWGVVSVSGKKEAPVHSMLSSCKSKKSLIMAAEIIQMPVSIRRRGKFRTYE